MLMDRFNVFASEMLELRPPGRGHWAVVVRPAVLE
jgi:hypothetical protein